MKKFRDLEPVTRAKLIYTIEIGIFVVVALTLGTLFLLRVLDFTERRGWVLSILGLAGGLWFIADFIWALFSKKHRAISSLFDKAILFPSGIGLLSFDIFIIVNAARSGMGSFEENYPGVFHLVIGIAFCYLSACYLAEAIYHWFHPLPALLDALPVEEEQGESDEPGSGDQESD